MTDDTIHTCSYSCERPGCIRAQRDELVARLEALTAARQQPAEAQAQGGGEVVAYSEKFRASGDWSRYPIGTRAYDIQGGYWERVANGWKWCTGSTFPTPGGDAFYVAVPVRVPAPPSAPVGVDFAAVASILRRAMRDGVHYGYRRDFILQQALALEALSHQPAAVDAGRAQRIQALVGGVEVDLKAPLQEQLAESKHAAAAQAAEIEALRAEVERWQGECMKVLGLLMQAQAEAKDLRGACDVYQARAERLAEALRKLEGREQSESFLEANDE